MLHGRAGAVRARLAVSDLSGVARPVVSARAEQPAVGSGKGHTVQAALSGRCRPTGRAALRGGVRAFPGQAGAALVEDDVGQFVFEPCPSWGSWRSASCGVPRGVSNRTVSPCCAFFRTAARRSASSAPGAGRSPVALRACSRRQARTYRQPAGQVTAVGALPGAGVPGTRRAEPTDVPGAESQGMGGASRPPPVDRPAARLLQRRPGDLRRSHGYGCGCGCVSAQARARRSTARLVLLCPSHVCPSERSRLESSDD